MNSTATSSKMPIGAPESSSPMIGCGRVTNKPRVLPDSASKVPVQAPMASDESTAKHEDIVFKKWCSIQRLYGRSEAKSNVID